MALDEKDRARAAYDTVASEYASRFHDELAQKPFDRAMLASFAERVAGDGLVCDLGCGPGQIGAFVASLGKRVHGIDLSPALVEAATKLHPTLAFSVGDMTALDGWAEGAFDALVAFYSIIHVPRNELDLAFAEMARVTRSGAPLLLSFHVGEETRTLDTWFDRAVDVSFHFHLPAVVCAKLAAVGFLVTESIERDPYPASVEAQTRRAYVFATRR